MKRLQSMVVCVLVACGGDGEAPPVGFGHGQCELRAGTFVARYTVRTGTCPVAPETLFSIATQPTAPEAPCTGSIAYSPDNCEVTYSSTCPNDAVAKGAEVTISGKSKWSIDAARGVATEQWVVRDAGDRVLCLGTYDVSLERQRG